MFNLIFDLNLIFEFYFRVHNLETLLGVSTKTINAQHGHVSIFNPFLTSKLVHPYHLDESSCSYRGFWWMFSFLLYFP